MKIPIPALSLGSLGNIVFKLIQLNEVVNKSKDPHIELDLSGVKFLPATYLTGIYCLIQNWRKAGRIVDILNINPIISSYLNTIQFTNGFNLVGNPKQVEKLSVFENKRYTPIVLFPPNDVWGGEVAREKCVNTVLNLIAGQAKLKSLTGTSIDYMVTELTNNIAEHSGANCGILFAQSYPSRGFMDISIADLGGGLLASYRKSTIFNPSNDIEAIDAAMNGKSTKQQAISRGFGISTSRKLIVQGLDGTFLLWSGRGWFAHNKDVEQIFAVSQDAAFSGCFIAIRLNIKDQKPFNFYEFVER